MSRIGGVDEARHDRREAQAVALVEGRPAREGQHRRLGGLVGRARDVGPAARDAADEHHVAARGAQRLEEGADEVERAREVERDEVVEGVGRELLEAAALDVGARRDDERVQRAVGGQALGQGADRRAIGDVEPMGDDVAPGGALLDQLGSARRGVDVGAGVGEGQRGGEADPARGPRDERGAPVERAHRQPSRPAPARKTLTSGGGGPSASRAKASGPSSSGRTAGSSPTEARPSTSHSSACSKSAIVYA